MLWRLECLAPYHQSVIFQNRGRLRYLALVLPLLLGGAVVGSLLALCTGSSSLHFGPPVELPQSSGLQDNARLAAITPSPALTAIAAIPSATPLTPPPMSTPS